MRIYFEVFYREKTLKGSSLEDWKSMPDEGVLGVVERTDRMYGHPRKYAGIRHAYKDYYWMTSDGQIGAGSAKYIPENVFIKRGLYVNDKEWEDIYNNRIMIDSLVEG